MIHLKIPGLPPSTNHAYTTIVKGRAPIRMLTKVGRAYKTETSALLISGYPTALAKIKPEYSYSAAYIFTTSRLTTKDWPRTAKNRFRKLDATNRVKLLEDVISEVTSVDDSNNMAVLVAKRHGDAERTDVFIWREDELDDPITSILRELGF